jgi:hypothetical protein
MEPEVRDLEKPVRVETRRVCDFLVGVRENADRFCLRKEKLVQTAVNSGKVSVPSAERWKVVKGEHWGPLDGLVEVSNRGNLRSLASGGENGGSSAAGLRQAMAAISDEMLARATAEAWLGAGLNHWILFMDGNRRNRRLHNLAILKMVMKASTCCDEGEMRPLRKTNGEPVFELVVRDVFEELVAYDPNRGRFYKQFSDKCRARVPDAAAGVKIPGHEKAFWEIGEKMKDGRLRLRLARRTVYGSRLALFMVTGQWPIHPVEFNDGDNRNLRIGNLRRR